MSITNIRSIPNILVTGTPGVGKTTLCEKLAALTGLQWQEISKIAIENGCIEEYDEEYKSGVLDEDKLLDGLEETLSCGGNIVDYHSCNLFPERWFDMVFVLQTDNTTLYDRLATRGYTGKKLEDNVQCEIFHAILEEALASYNPEIVRTLSSTNYEDLEKNIHEIAFYIKQWIDLYTAV